MTLEERLGENFSDYIVEEYCLTHSLYGNTAECAIFVEIQEPNGKRWKGERIIKMRLRSSEKAEAET